MLLGSSKDWTLGEIFWARFDKTTKERLHIVKTENTANHVSFKVKVDHKEYVIKIAKVTQNTYSVAMTDHNDKEVEMDVARYPDIENLVRTMLGLEDLDEGEPY